MHDYRMNHLDKLEAEAIYIFREAVAQAEKPVMLYSIGKDSSVLLHLAKKAFSPGSIPFPLLHVDTGFKFREMIAFRDNVVRDNGLTLLVQKNEEPAALALSPTDAQTEEYIYLKKTKPLLAGLRTHGFDAAFGGARRDEEKSRAKERIFSIRNEFGVWDPKNQRPEVWQLYNAGLRHGQTLRVFPLSNWTELDIWQYIKREQIDIVPLYFAEKRNVLQRHGVWLRIDEYVQPNDSEEVIEMWCRYRTLGCSPSTGAVPSRAQTLDEIIEEVLTADTSERVTRAIDQTSESSMEKKKREGYF